MTDLNEQSRRKPWLAALLSLLTSGLGQVYNGQVRKGVLFFCVGTLLGGVFAMGVVTFTWLVAVVGLILVFTLFVAGEAYFAARSRQEYVLQKYNRWWVYVFVFALNIGIGFGMDSIMTGTTYRTYKVPSESMLNTLYVGDYFIAELLPDTSSIEREQIVVFDFEGRTFVKRVIGLPGETVAMENKVVFINGKPLDEPYALHSVDANIPERDYFSPLKLKSNEFFLMGDNRERSYDSRWFGPVEGERILGRAKYIYYPGASPRGLDRLGQEIQ